MTKSIEINSQNFTLHASGALYWREEDLLLISDVHFGKVTHFRKYGSAVPLKAMEGNFEKLNQVVNFFGAGRICFLGDLFHSALNWEWILFERWVATLSSEIILIEGNHDIISPLKYEAAGVKVFSEMVLNGFLLTHHPEKRETMFNLSGHLHPGIKLYGPGRQELKLPCFFKSRNQMILPAFGEFTGNFWLAPQQGEEVYMITGKEIILKIF